MRWAVWLLVVAACGGGDGDDPPAPDAGVLARYAPCDPATHVGTFEVELASAYTGVKGNVLDGVLPGTVLDTVTSEGACRIARAPVYFCDPACTGGETCTASGQCAPFPTGQDVGTVTVAGLLAALEMQPRAPGNFYTNPAPLPHPGYDPGADIALAATGGSLQPFALLGWGVDALLVPGDPVVVDSGSPLALTWTAPADPGPARVTLALNVNEHGVTGSRIECVVDDTGAFEIPAALVTALIDDGLSGYPTLEITRTTADSVTIAPGCVELRVLSRVVIDVEVPGLISCTDNAGCPVGQTCQPDLTCQ